MKKLLFTAAMLFATAASFAQVDPAAIKAAKKLADGKKFTEAKAAVKELMANPAAATDAAALDVAGYAYWKQFDEQGNKAMLQQEYDEAALNEGAMNAFKYWFECDKIAETTPNAKGKIDNKYRKNNAEKLSQPMMRNCLINGGVGAIQKEDYKTAMEYLGLYVDLAKQPMMAKYKIAETDTVFGSFAFYAVYAAANAKDWNAVLEYAPYGLMSAEDGHYAQQFKCQALKELNRMDEWMNAIQEGMAKFPTDNFFSSSLIDYFVSSGKGEEGLAYINGEIAKDPNNYYNYYMKGFMLNSQKNFNDADEAYQKATSMNSDNAQLYSFAGQNMFDAAAVLDEKADADQNEINGYLKRALPYFEKAQQLAPEDKSMWFRFLNTIYYRLQMDDKYNALQSQQ